MNELNDSGNAQCIRQDVRCWWTLDPAPGNMGDILTPVVLAVYEHTVTRVPREEVEWLFIVSTIRFARPGVRIVGTGVIDRRERIEPRAHYHAVRGPITADLVRRAGCKPPVVLGGPALLLPRFDHPDVEPTVPIGLFHTILITAILRWSIGTKPRSTYCVAIRSMLSMMFVGVRRFSGRLSMA